MKYELAVEFIGFVTSQAGQKVVRNYGKKELGKPLYFTDAIP